MSWFWSPQGAMPRGIVPPIPAVSARAMGFAVDLPGTAPRICLYEAIGDWVEYDGMICHAVMIRVDPSELRAVAQWAHKACVENGGILAVPDTVSKGLDWKPRVVLGVGICGVRGVGLREEKHVLNGCLICQELSSSDTGNSSENDQVRLANDDRSSRDTVSLSSVSEELPESPTRMRNSTLSRSPMSSVTVNRTR